MSTYLGNPFKYKCYDLVTGGLITELPFTQVSFGRQLNQPGTWQGVLPIADSRVQKLAWQDGTNPGRVGLFVDFLGTLIWGGIVWTRNYDSFDPTKSLKISASEFGSYLQQRRQAFDYTSTFAAGTDPMLVAQRIVSDTLAVSGSTIMGGLNLALSPSGGEGGPLIEPSYPGTAPQTIDSMLAIISQMGYGVGFDYSADVAYLPGTQTPSVTINIWYPRRGRTYAQSGIVIESAQGTFTYPEDGTQTANDVLETGSGTGNVEPVDASISIPGYPLYQRVFPRTQVNDDLSLSNIAEGDLSIYAYPVPTPTLTLPLSLPNAQGVTDPGRLQFGTFDIGDDLLFRVDPAGGENADPRFPNGMSFEWRINAWTLTVGDKGVTRLVLDLAIPPSVTIPPPPPPGAS